MTDIVLRDDLYRYQNLSEECEKLAERISRNKERLGNVKSPQITDNPGGGKRSDFTDEIHELEDLQAEHERSCKLRDECYTFLNDTINKVPDFKNRDILRLRHVLFMSWQEVADETGWEESTVKKRYAKMFDHVLRLDGVA